MYGRLSWALSRTLNSEAMRSTRKVRTVASTLLVPCMDKAGSQPRMSESKAVAVNYVGTLDEMNWPVCFASCPLIFRILFTKPNSEGDFSSQRIVPFIASIPTASVIAPSECCAYSRNSDQKCPTYPSLRVMRVNVVAIPLWRTVLHEPLSLGRVCDGRTFGRFDYGYT